MKPGGQKVTGRWLIRPKGIGLSFIMPMKKTIILSEADADRTESMDSRWLVHRADAGGGAVPEATVTVQPSDGALALADSGRLGLRLHFFGGERLGDYIIEDNRLVLQADSNKHALPLFDSDAPCVYSRSFRYGGRRGIRHASLV